MCEPFGTESVRRSEENGTSTKATRKNQNERKKERKKALAEWNCLEQLVEREEERHDGSSSTSGETISLESSNQIGSTDESQMCSG